MKKHLDGYLGQFQPYSFHFVKFFVAVEVHRPLVKTNRKDFRIVERSNFGKGDVFRQMPFLTRFVNCYERFAVQSSKSDSVLIDKSVVGVNR